MRYVYALSGCVYSHFSVCERGRRRGLTDSRLEERFADSLLPICTLGQQPRAPCKHCRSATAEDAAAQQSGGWGGGVRLLHVRAPSHLLLPAIAAGGLFYSQPLCDEDSWESGSQPGWRVRSELRIDEEAFRLLLLMYMSFVIPPRLPWLDLSPLS